MFSHPVKTGKAKSRGFLTGSKCCCGFVKDASDDRQAGKIFLHIKIFSYFPRTCA